MEFKGSSHIYKCTPVGWFNKDGTITVNLKCAPKADCLEHQRNAETYAVEEQAVKQREFIAQFVESIEGLVVDGKKITTFSDLYKYGPPDVYDWVYTAVLSQKVLTETEIKN